MVKRLLIDATHTEEVRVAVVNGTTLEEFDTETSNKRLIKSNIYLAKVIRVEPSLQAAFVEYSGGRHGFLPFAEIHPDYYRIPVGDRAESEVSDDTDTTNEISEDVISDIIDVPEIPTEPVALIDSESEEPTDTVPEKKRGRKRVRSRAAKNDTAVSDNETIVSEIVDQNDQEPIISTDVQETVSEDSAVNDDEVETASESMAEKKPTRYRYKIQEVIKRRQILLIQVVKEERGNKGAALTTYLSLPGRYCVLMPNSGHKAGGVSRKISDGEDRRRLRELMKEFEVPDGMSLIVRTAGQERNRAEIKRDYEYLLRVWDEIRENTLKSIAPALVYAEGDLVKRAIRDIYDRDVEEVLVEGEEAYKSARLFMKNLIPSHVKKVKLYKDLLQPIFHRFNVETQIEKMHEPVQALPSGGSIVINHTEALVAIDINSGKSTRERHIDDTAFKTNMEAAAEIARQLRLRDIGGLVVIDFIDMHDSNSIAQVERKLRDSLKHDRARIQIGRIGQFGLLELSRQRLRPSLLESHSKLCDHCHGTGLVRSVDSLALQILREIERIAIMGSAQELLATVPNGVDLYLLNQKRSTIVHMETRFDVSIQINRDDTLMSPNFKLSVVSERARAIKLVDDTKAPIKIETDVVEDEADDQDGNRHNNRRSNNNRRRRGNRRGHRSHNENQTENPMNEAGNSETDGQSTADSAPAQQNRNRHHDRKRTERSQESTSTSVDDQVTTEPRADSDEQTERNPNRRRRHPYQRRGQQRPREDNNDVSVVAVDAPAPSSADPVKREKAPARPRKTEGSTDVPTETGESKKTRKPKNWLRRLLD